MNEYDVEKATGIAANNSANVAAIIVAAQIREGSGFDENEFNRIRRIVFDGTMELSGVELLSEFFDNGNETVAPKSSGSKKPNATMTINSGKYRGKTIAEVAETDEDYLKWLAEKSNNDFLRNAVQKYLAA